jgi:acetyl-CoA acetyltransferase
VPETCQAFFVDAPHAALLAAVQHDLGVPPARINPDGGTLARGRGGAAEGLCLLVDLLDWLEETGQRYGACVELLPDGGAAAVVLDCEAWA